MIQSSGQAKSTRLHFTTPNSFLSHIPLSVWLVAALVALLHLAPLWRAQLQTPTGWTFTGNVNGSPDYMQYRVWMRQTQETGVLVANKFTSEPNKPHLLVVFYYALGKVSYWLNTAPELIYAYSGSLFASALVVLLFSTVRHFLKLAYQVWWVFLVILIGGGLGAHLKILIGFEFLASNPILQRIIFEPLRSWPVFEDYRGNYLFLTLFDTHYLFIWIIFMISILSLYFTLKEFSLGRLILTAILYAATTIVHVYEGPTLIMINLAVVFLSWRKGLKIRSAFVTATLCTLAVSACLMLQVIFYRSSGLPIPPWRAVNILASTLLIGYPLAWVLIAWGIGDYWQKAEFNECFLLGWALGCIILTLAGPFYPYPDRGLMTLQIPIYLIAGTIYFYRHVRVTPLAALVMILVLGATPIWMLVKVWQATTFDSNAPYVFMSRAHREIVDVLQEQASEDDVLLIDKSDLPWKTDDLWLAPEYPGKFYCSHFFLTADYERKRAEVVSFFKSDNSEEQAGFLRKRKIRFLYTRANEDPKHFTHVPGLILLKAAPFGSLFEYIDGAG
jgi:hypothetical protein